jgi:DNA transformation protein
MAVGAGYLQYVLEQLERAGPITSRRMFGAVGLYCDSVFFGLVDDDTLFFKVGDETRPEYESRGMKPFRPYADRPEVSLSYFTVPADVLDDPEEVTVWARRAIRIAAAQPKKPKLKKPKLKKKTPMKTTNPRSAHREKSS